MEHCLSKVLFSHKVLKQGLQLLNGSIFHSENILPHFLHETLERHLLQTSLESLHWLLLYTFCHYRLNNPGVLHW
jgi:hypothetical protein